MCLYAPLRTWQSECVSGQMLCGVVLSYTLPEWDRISVLSFIMQLDDSSCDNPWLSTKLPRWPNLPRASHLHPCASVLACLSVCLYVAQVGFWGAGEWGGWLLGQGKILEQVHRGSAPYEHPTLLQHTGALCPPVCPPVCIAKLASPLLPIPVIASLC